MSSNPFHKKIGVVEDFDRMQIVELAKCRQDPVYFAKNYIHIIHPKRGKILFVPHDYQVRMIEAFQAGDFVICRAGRQLGKSTVIAIYLLWFALFHREKTVLVASNKNSNAMEIMQRINYAYEELPSWLKTGIRYGTKHSLDFENGSRIISQATTEDTGRGLAISLLMLDELAFVPKNIQELMWTSLAPTLSNGGRCIVSSTPNGDSDLFAELWYGAEFKTNGFIPVYVAWDEHPERDEAFRANMIAKLGVLKWKQEYECEFLSSDPLLISSLVLNKLKSTDHVMEDFGFRFWIDTFDPEMSYYVGADVSSGTGGDYSTIEVVEYPTMRQVAEFRRNDVSTPILYAHIKWIIKYITTHYNTTKARQPPDVYWSFESNGVGESIRALYMVDEHFPPDAMMVNDDDRFGMYTSNKSKRDMAHLLKGLVERNPIGIGVNSDILIAELKNYIAKKTTYEARTGCTDDLISALYVVLRMIAKTAAYDMESIARLYGSASDADLSLMYGMGGSGEGQAGGDAGGRFDDEPMAFVM